MKRVVLAILLISSLMALRAQEISVKAGFEQDSLKIAEPVQFWMSVRYPIAYELLMPDSLFDFTPFEYVGLDYFETRRSGEVAIDSVIYSLQSFEIDKIQILRLPATLLIKEDTAKIWSPRDSIYLVELVPIATDTTALMENTEYVYVPRQFNTNLLLIIVGFLIVLAIVVLIVFGKKIKRYFLIRRMERAHRQFVDKMTDLVQLLKKEGTPNQAERTLIHWKSYQEKIEQLPFTKLTSKEILEYEFTEELRSTLSNIDRCVYGKIPSDKVYQEFEHLEDFAVNRYRHRLETIKHGS